MDNKKSVLLYCDIIHTVEKLEDAEAGKLFKHYLRYINDLNPEAPDKLTEIIFEPIKQTLKRDLRKWETKSERNSEIAKAGWEKRKNANACERIKPDAKHADSVIVIDKDIVKDKDINNKEIFENLKFELFNSATWLSDCERTLKTKKIKLYLTEFLDDLFLKEDFYKEISEVKKHFVNWVKVQMEKDKQKQPENTGTSQYEKVDYSKLRR